MFVCVCEREKEGEISRKHAHVCRVHYRFRFIIVFKMKPDRFILRLQNQKCQKNKIKAKLYNSII
jgi:hypothetical protein